MTKQAAKTQGARISSKKVRNRTWKRDKKREQQAKGIKQEEAEKNGNERDAGARNKQEERDTRNPEKWQIEDKPANLPLRQIPRYDVLNLFVADLFISSLGINRVLTKILLDWLILDCILTFHLYAMQEYQELVGPCFKMDGDQSSIDFDTLSLTSLWYVDLPPANICQPGKAAFQTHAWRVSTARDPVTASANSGCWRFEKHTGFKMIV